MTKYIGIVGTSDLCVSLSERAATKGAEVLLYDVNDTVLRRATERIHSALKIKSREGILAPDEVSKIIARVHPRTNISDLRTAELVIESTIEDLKTKANLFTHLSMNAKQGAVLATTTASFSIASIAYSTDRPDRVIGLHFPLMVDPNAMAEMVTIDPTSLQTIEKVQEILGFLNISSIRVNDVPGFLANRISQAFYGESLQIIKEGTVTPEQLDTIARQVGGFRLGPFEYLDRIGLDAALNSNLTLFERTFHEPRFRPDVRLSQMVESGLHGKKSGERFHAYVKVKKI